MKRTGLAPDHAPEESNALCQVVSLRGRSLIRSSFTKSDSNGIYNLTLTPVVKKINRLLFEST